MVCTYDGVGGGTPSDDVVEAAVISILIPLTVPVQDKKAMCIPRTNTVYGIVRSRDQLMYSSFL